MNCSQRPISIKKMNGKKQTNMYTNVHPLLMEAYKSKSASAMSKMNSTVKSNFWTIITVI